MDYLGRVQRGVDFIDQHLSQEIPLATVAERAGISQWHFQRIFKALTQETLKSYIRGRRLAHARSQLLETDARIIEVAIGAGYDSQEAFTRAFKQAFGVTPAAFRAAGQRLPLPGKVQLSPEYLRHLQGNIELQPELIVQPAMCLVGLKTCYYGAASEKNDMAEKLPALWAEFIPRLTEVEGRIPGTCYGVIRQTPAQAELLEYFAAIEVSQPGIALLPPDMCQVLLPTTTYARFAHRGPVKALDHTVNYIYSAWLCGSGRRHTYAADLEIYGPAFHPTSDESLIHYAIPVE